jgi:glycosyltransferase involved in cell wall biosynthesis
MPVHVLMVAPQPFFRPRGTPFSVLHRIRAMCRLGHTVELVTYPFGESPEVAGLTIHRAPRPPLVGDVGIGPSFAKILLDLPLFRLADRLAASGRFHLLHTHEEAGWMGGRIRRRYGLPHLYDMHSSLPQQLENFGRFNWRPVVAAFRGLEDRTLASADAVIAICPELGDHLQARGYTGPVEVIENTLDFHVPEPEDGVLDHLRRELRLQGRRVVVYTGTLERYQGLDLLLAAAPLVLRQMPEALFLLVGGTTSQIDGLRADATAAGVGAAFRFVPAVPPEEVVRYHRLADALVTTRSRGTNTPLKIYQYLRAGRPIVATAIRSHTQVLDGASAELVRPEAAEVAAGIVRVLADPARARQLSEGASRLAEERYSEAAYMAALERILGTFSGGAGAARRTA